MRGRQQRMLVCMHSATLPLYFSNRTPHPQPLNTSQPIAPSFTTLGGPSCNSHVTFFTYVHPAIPHTSAGCSVQGAGCMLEVGRLLWRRSTHSHSHKLMFVWRGGCEVVSPTTKPLPRPYLRDPPLAPSFSSLPLTPPQCPHGRLLGGCGWWWLQRCLRCSPVEGPLCLPVSVCKAPVLPPTPSPSPACSCTMVCAP
jgi:hypothetical protein